MCNSLHSIQKNIFILNPLEFVILNYFEEIFIGAQKKGVDVEELDTPLDEETHQQVADANRSHYDWTLAANRMVSDGLLGRIKRQFDKQAIAVFKVAKVTTLAQAHKGQDPKRRRAPNVPLE